MLYDDIFPYLHTMYVYTQYMCDMMPCQQHLSCSCLKALVPMRKRWYDTCCHLPKRDRPRRQKNVRSVRRIRQYKLARRHACRSHEHKQLNLTLAENCHKNRPPHQERSLFMGISCWLGNHFIELKSARDIFWFVNVGPSSPCTAPFRQNMIADGCLSSVSCSFLYTHLASSRVVPGTPSSK